MTLRAYYLQAARLKHKSDQATRYFLALDQRAARYGYTVRDRTDLKRYRETRVRAERIRTFAAEQLIAARVARNEAQERMLFDSHEAAREQRRREFLRRNWS